MLWYVQSIRRFLGADHLQIYGGDQTYIDFIFKDIPFLKRWTSSEMDFDTMYKHEFSEEVSTQCASYYFHTYCENWERPEVKSALQSCPVCLRLLKR